MHKFYFKGFLLSLVLLASGSFSELSAQCLVTTGPTNDCSYGDAIDVFTLNSQSAVGNSGCSNASGYIDYPNQYWNLTAGVSYAFSATVGGTQYNQGMAIWIDYNNDGVFASTEQLWTSAAAALSHSGNITIPLSAVSDTVHMRVMVAYNQSSIPAANACTSNQGSYGETEDYRVIITNPANQYPDAAMVGGYMTPVFTSIPMSQTFNFNGIVSSVGSDTINNVKSVVTVGTWKDSASVAQMLPGETDTLMMPTTYVPSATGAMNAEFVVSVSDNDTVTSNDTANVAFEVSDSVYAHDDATVTGTLGIGSGFTGFLGSKFVVTQTDYLTSVSFHLQNAVQGDTTYVTIWDFSGGQPNTVIASTDTMMIDTTNGKFLTYKFNCPVMLTPGEYLVAIYEEMDTTVGLSHTQNVYEPMQSWAYFSGSWAPLENFGFFTTYLIRANFGQVMMPMASASNQVVCFGDTVMLNAMGGYGNFTWSPSAGLTNTSGDTTWAFPGSNTTYVATDGCGMTDSVMLTANPMITLNMGSNPETSGMNNGQAWTTAGGGTPPFTYLWNDPSNQTTDTANGLAAGSYMVIVTDSNGCTASDTVTVSVITALDEELNGEMISIYPNPSNGVFNISGLNEIGNTVEVAIYDVNGRMVYQQTVTGKDLATVSLPAGFSNGVYTLKLSGSKQNVQRQVIIQK